MDLIETIRKFKEINVDIDLYKITNEEKQNLPKTPKSIWIV